MKKLISFILILCVLMAVIVFPTCAGSIYAKGRYVSEFEAYMAENKCYPLEDEYMYGDSYYDFFSESNDTDTPDWLVARGTTLGISPAPTYGVFGDYYVSLNEYRYPYALGTYIYVPSESKFYTLEEAWEANFDGIENAFTEGLISRGFAGIIGDADKDGVFTVMDVTQIQLVIASLVHQESVSLEGLCVYGEELKYFADFDRDGELSILDATAIQLKLAGIE